MAKRRKLTLGWAKYSGGIVELKEFKWLPHDGSFLMTSFEFERIASLMGKRLVDKKRRK